MSSVPPLPPATTEAPPPSPPATIVEPPAPTTSVVPPPTTDGGPSTTTTSSTTAATGRPRPTTLPPGPSTSVVPPITSGTSPSGKSTDSSANAPATPSTSAGQTVGLTIGIVGGALLLAMVGIYLFRKKGLRPSNAFRKRMEPPVPLSALGAAGASTTTAAPIPGSPVGHAGSGSVILTMGEDASSSVQGQGQRYSMASDSNVSRLAYQPFPPPGNPFVTPYPPHAATAPQTYVGLDGVTYALAPSAFQPGMRPSSGYLVPMVVPPPGAMGHRDQQVHPATPNPAPPHEG